MCEATISGPIYGKTGIVGKEVRRVDEALVVAGSSARSVIERVIITLRGIEGCVVTQPSIDVVHIAETAKKFMGRTTSVCVVTAVSEPQRLVVHVQGQLHGERLESLKAAILGTSLEGLRDYSAASFAPPAQSGFGQPVQRMHSPPVQGVQQFQQPAPSLAPMPPHLNSPPPGVATHRGIVPAPAVFQPADDWFVPRPTQPADAGRTEMRVSSVTPPMGGHLAAPPTARVYQVQLSDGRRFELGSMMLVGRSPAASSPDAAASLIAIDDEGISKTHAAIGRHGDESWVEDRHSRNGTVLVDQSGRQIVLIPGQRTMFRMPATVLVGDTVISLVQL
jgi:FHA domain